MLKNQSKQKWAIYFWCRWKWVQWYRKISEIVAYLLYRSIGNNCEFFKRKNKIHSVIGINLTYDDRVSIKWQNMLGIFEKQSIEKKKSHTFCWRISFIMTKNFHLHTIPNICLHQIYICAGALHSTINIAIIPKQFPIRNSKNVPEFSRWFHFETNT